MENRFVSLSVPDTQEIKRLDTFIASCTEANLSRSKTQSLIESGKVTVNGRIVTKSSYSVAALDVIEICIPPQETIEVAAQDIPLNIVYEDDSVLVINKPRGMVVHPAAGHREGTLVNALLSYCPEISAIGERTRPGIVHRLDKDTTGLLVVAKDANTLNALQSQIQARKAKRKYLVLCKGAFKEDEGTINAPIGRHPADRKRMAVIENTSDGESRITRRARNAVTEWRVVASFGAAYTLLAVKLITGRTHQIRVHLSYIGHPVAADPLYGKAGRELKLTGQALHAYRLGLFLGQRFDEYREFTAPLPEDFSKVLISLRNKYREEIPACIMLQNSQR